MEEEEVKGATAETTLSLSWVSTSLFLCTFAIFHHKRILLYISSINQLKLGAPLLTPLRGSGAGQE